MRVLVTSKEQAHQYKDVFDLVVSVIDQGSSIPVLSKNHFVFKMSESFLHSKSDQLVEQLLEFIKERNITLESSMLFHCKLGVSRSPACAIGTLVALGKKPEEAVWNIQRVRPKMFPNSYIVKAFDKALNLDKAIELAVEDNEIRKMTGLVY